MVDGRRISQQDQSGHPGLDHDHLSVIQPDHHPFASATDVGNPLPAHAPVEGIDPWTEQDRPSLTGRTFGCDNLATDDRQ